jgi:hypothetical protein
MLYLNKPVTVPQCMTTASTSKYYIEEHVKIVHIYRRVRLPRVGSESRQRRLLEVNIRRTEFPASKQRKIAGDFRSSDLEA